MKRKEPTKMISIRENPLISMVYGKLFQRCKGSITDSLAELSRNQSVFSCPSFNPLTAGAAY